MFQNIRRAFTILSRSRERIGDGRCSHDGRYRCSCRCVRRVTSGSPPTCTACRAPSLRHYVRTREPKAAGMDWTAVLAAADENSAARLAAEWLASDRLRQHRGAGRGVRGSRAAVCRATFFNYRRKLGGGNRNGNEVG